MIYRVSVADHCLQRTGSCENALCVCVCVLTDGMEVDAASMEPGQFEDADVEHW